MTEQQNQTGCGSSRVMGHGENAICGQPFYNGIYVCADCQKRKLASQLAIACALLEALIAEEGPQPGTAEWADAVRAFLKGVMA